MSSQQNDSTLGSTNGGKTLLQTYLDMVNEGKKQQVLINMREILSTDPSLPQHQSSTNPFRDKTPAQLQSMKRTVIAICASKHKILKISSNDLIALDIEKMILGYLSGLQRRQTKMKVLENIFLVLGKCFHEAQTFDLANSSQSKDYNFQKIIDCLTMILGQKGVGDTVRLRCLQFIHSLIRHNYKKSEFFNRVDLAALIMKALEEGNLEIKVKASELILMDSEEEVKIWTANDRNRQKEENKKDKETIDKEFIGSAGEEEKYRDMGEAVISCLLRFRSKEFMLNLLETLYNLCLIPGVAGFLFNDKLSKRILDLCSRPVTPEITRSAIKLLSLLSKNGFIDTNKDDMVQQILDEVKKIIKDKDLQKKNYQMYLSILDLLQFLLSSKAQIREQKAILNLLNMRLGEKKAMNTHQIMKILDLNIKVHTENKSVYLKQVKPVVFEHCLHLASDKKQAEEVRNASVKILNFFRKSKKGNFALDGNSREMLSEMEVLDKEYSLQILNDSLRRNANISVLMGSSSFFGMCEDLVVEQGEGRKKVAYLLDCLAKIGNRKMNLGNQVRRRVLEESGSKLIRSIIEALEIEEDDDDACDNNEEGWLIQFLDLVCLNRTKADYRKIFNDHEEPLERVRELSEEATNEQLRKMFMVIHMQLANEKEDVGASKGKKGKDDDDGDSVFNIHKPGEDSEYEGRNGSEMESDWAGSYNTEEMGEFLNASSKDGSKGTQSGDFGLPKRLKKKKDLKVDTPGAGILMNDMDDIFSHDDESKMQSIASGRKGTGSAFTSKMSAFGSKAGSRRDSVKVNKIPESRMSQVDEDDESAMDSLSDPSSMSKKSKSSKLSKKARPVDDEDF